MDPTLAVSRPSNREVRVERIADAPRETVWRAFTDAELVARWWGRGHRLTVERFDMRLGGHWRFVEHAADGDYGFEGRFREVQPPSRLSETFEWDGAPGHVSVTTVELHEVDEERTRIVETSMFMTAEDSDAMMSTGMLEGMGEGFAALDSLLASMRQGTGA